MSDSREEVPESLTKLLDAWAYKLLEPYTRDAIPAGYHARAERASLDAALLALVQDAERLNWCENVVSAITVCDEHGDETEVRCEMSRADQTFREFLDAARHTPGGQDNG